MSQRRRQADPSIRRRPVTDAEPSEHLQNLTLQELRGYRRGLTIEEERTSYWRRLVQARMDVLEAQSHVEGTLSIDQLVRVLGDTGSGQVRSALLRIRPSDRLPDLPALTETWDAAVDPHDPDEVARALDRLRQAENDLSEYRRALHERIDEATAELIVRYREDPTAALSVLPEG